MKKGFYTALGTPLDREGNFIEESYRKHICSQIDAGASGLLILGSMGRQHAIRNDQYPKIAAAGADEVRSRVPAFVGVMDNSYYRVMDRIEALGDIAIDGVVATTPFYTRDKTEVLINFFQMIADNSRFPLYLYDLPAVTQNPLSVSDVKILMKHPNIKGIKTANIMIARNISRDSEKPEDFNIFFSDLEYMDIAYRSGIDHNLDGMFSCTPQLAGSMFKALAEGDFKKASELQDIILDLRRLFACSTILPSFTTAMNILGFEGSFHQDYYIENTEEEKRAIFEYIKKYEKVKI